MANGVNFAIGPSCFVKCLGCYDHFGNTAKRGGLIRADDVLGFAKEAGALGVAEVTLSGGDPLTHPDIVEIARGLKDNGFFVNLDTVGKAFLAPAKMAFYGDGEISQVDMFALRGSVDLLGIPIDGPSDAVIGAFRISRTGSMLADGLTLIRMSAEHRMSTCVNTVLHRQNVAFLPELAEVIANSGAKKWQIFEFQPIGPLGSRNASLFRLEPGEFAAATRKLPYLPNIAVQTKDAAARKEAYFMVDDAGFAWHPGEGADREVIGHVSRDRDLVLVRLARHLASRTTLDFERDSLAVPSPH